MSDTLKGWELPLPALKKLAPKASPLLLEIISENLVEWAPVLGGLTTKVEVQEFLAQLLEESGELTRFEEGLSYSSGDRLMKVWPSRFPTQASAAPYVRNAKGLANKVYANRMGNGNEASGDGYRYRGRCGLQATGKEMYSKVSAILDFDFVTRPDDLASPMWVIPGSLAIAKILKLGDVHGMEQDTRRLNGGTTNLANRKALFAKVQKLLP